MLNVQTQRHVAVLIMLTSGRGHDVDVDSAEPSAPLMSHLIDTTVRMTIRQPHKPSILVTRCRHSPRQCPSHHAPSVDGLCLKEHAGTADHPGGSSGQNILEIKRSGR